MSFAIGTAAIVPRMEDAEAIGGLWPAVFFPRLFPGPPPSSLSRTGPQTRSGAV